MIGRGIEKTKKVLCILFSLILIVVSANIRVSAEEKDDFDVYVRDNFYEIASLCEIDPYKTSYHATALVGTPSATEIKIADPHGTSNTNTISYSTASFYSSGISYTWNSGYYSHLTY